MRKLYSRSREDSQQIIVDWNLGNICSLKCSYCSPRFHKGDHGFPDIVHARQFVDEFAAKRKGSNRPVKFSFVGGEPTEYADFVDLCTHIRNMMSASIHIMSNAAADIKTWSEIAPVVHTAALSFHAGKVSPEHYKAVCWLLRGSGVAVSCVFAMNPSTFDISLSLRNEMQAHGYAGLLQPLYADHTGRTQLLDYTDEQIDLLFPKSKLADIVIENGADELAMTTETIIHERRNSFTGMKCGIGIDQLVIDQWGNIRGGWCGVGGIIGNVNEGWFNPIDEPLTCTKATCNNPLDLSVPKWEE